MSEFTERIDSLLEAGNLKRSDLCRATGIADSVIRAWIKRDSMPNADYALKVAKFFGVSVEYLVTGENEENEIKLLLSAEEEELIHIFRAMSSDQKEFLINNARFLITQSEQKKEQTKKENIG